MIYLSNVQDTALHKVVFKSKIRVLLITKTIEDCDTQATTYIICHACSIGIRSVPPRTISSGQLPPTNSPWSIPLSYDTMTVWCKSDSRELLLYFNILSHIVTALDKRIFMWFVHHVNNLELWSHTLQSYYPGFFIHMIHMIE